MQKAITCPFCKKQFFAKKRTNKQNDRYWGLILPTIAEHLGYFPDELHEEMKLLFNAKDSKLTPGAKYGATTTNLSTQDFNVYVDKVVLWAEIYHGIVFHRDNYLDS